MDEKTTNNVVRIRVFELIGGGCAAFANQAEPVHKAICAALDAGERVSVDFTGIDTLTTDFLDQAFGALYAKYPREKLNQSVKFVGLCSWDRGLLGYVLRSAREYYAANPLLAEAASSSELRTEK